MKCSITETQKLAEDLARRMSARIYALVGELGAGKTTFTQFFLRALGVTEPIASPTFVIMKPYILHNLPYTRAYHIDCYRLENPRELLALGFQAIINDSHNIVIIEWADTIKDFIPPEAQWLYFEHGKRHTERIITAP